MAPGLCSIPVEVFANVGRFVAGPDTGAVLRLLSDVAMVDDACCSYATCALPACALDSLRRSLLYDPALVSIAKHRHGQRHVDMTASRVSAVALAFSRCISRYVSNNATDVRVQRGAALSTTLQLAQYVEHDGMVFTVATMLYGDRRADAFYNDLLVCLNTACTTGNVGRVRRILRETSHLPNVFPCDLLYETGLRHLLTAERDPIDCALRILNDRRANPPLAADRVATGRGSPTRQEWVAFERWRSTISIRRPRLLSAHEILVGRGLTATDICFLYALAAQRGLLALFWCRVTSILHHARISYSDLIVASRSDARFASLGQVLQSRTSPDGFLLNRKCKFVIGRNILFVIIMLVVALSKTIPSDLGRAFRVIAIVVSAWVIFAAVQVVHSLVQHRDAHRSRRYPARPR
ncbi:Uncharacterized protein PBTT_04447 [Plasmodiophora brassicae]|uniref:Uncharacterized protein n=1 Tax=Plasmodiophora brassicae TaxID=37360 RepID=A0A0G4J2L3_PLABS|nr:hypothetical protein PBRA_008816 [Plasmodiophora brassicae]SPQ96558.1 unnamed protein product [Plasmodiophora brassicae]